MARPECYQCKLRPTPCEIAALMRSLELDDDWKGDEHVQNSYHDVGSSYTPSHNDIEC